MRQFDLMCQFLFSNYSYISQFANMYGYDIKLENSINIKEKSEFKEFKMQNIEHKHNLIGRGKRRKN